MYVIAAPQYAIPGIMLNLYAIVLFGGLLRQFVAARSLNYSQPLTEVQTELEKLRVFRIHTTQWAVFVGVALWAPALIVVIKGVLDVDPYQFLNLPWLIANIAFGLAMIPLFYWISRRMSERVSQSPFLQQVMRDLAGRSLADAATSLSEVAAFQHES